MKSWGGGGGVLPGNLGGGVQHTPLNPYPIFRPKYVIFPYFSPDPKFDASLFQTCRRIASNSQELRR